MHAQIKRMRRATYYGSPVEAFRGGGFHLVESVYAPGEELPAHLHSNAHFCLVLSGAYAEGLEGGTEERRPAELIFYPAAVDHAELHHQPGRHFLIEVEPSLFARLATVSGAIPRVSLHGLGRTLATRVYLEFRRGGKASRPLLGRLVRQLVTAATAEPAGVGSDWLAEAAARLRGEPESPPALGRLAAELGVHPVHLGRAFRRGYGCTPGEYLRRQRVEIAQRSLAGSDLDLAGVAYAAGFCDQSHLNRVFKRHTGVTPGHYRRLVKASG